MGQRSPSNNFYVPLHHGRDNDIGTGGDVRPIDRIRGPGSNKQEEMKKNDKCPSCGGSKGEAKGYCRKCRAAYQRAYRIKNGPTKRTYYETDELVNAFLSIMNLKKAE